MIDEYSYDRANSMYSHGLISFSELIAVIKENVTLKELEEERMTI